MSLRLRLSLAIAAVAALVAAGIGFAVYDRAVDERLDTARRGVAEDVRRARPRRIPTRPRSTRHVHRRRRRAGGRRAEPRRARPARSCASRCEPSPGASSPSCCAAATTRRSSAARRCAAVARVYMQRRFGADEAALRNLRRAIIQIVIGAALLGALVGALVAALISQPLRRSVALARRLAAGDLQARLRPKGNNEIAELGRALDDMADALGTKLAELDQAAERERRFSADVAHELRTPITGLVAAASLLDDSPEAAHGARAGVGAGGAGRGPAGGHAPGERLGGGARRALRPRAAGARRRGASARRTRSSTRRRASWWRAIRGAWSACWRTCSTTRCATASRPVCVIVRRDGTVTVRDYGEGFGAFLDRAGERFAMASSSRSGGGTGLGLAIAHGQARLLGGELELVDADGAVATLHLHSNGHGNGNGRPREPPPGAGRRPGAARAGGRRSRRAARRRLGVRDEGNAGTASASIPVDEVSVEVPGPEVHGLRPGGHGDGAARRRDRGDGATTVPELPTERGAAPGGHLPLPLRPARRRSRSSASVRRTAPGGRCSTRCSRRSRRPRRSLRYTTAIPEGTTVRSYVGVRGHGERRPLAGVRQADAQGRLPARLHADDAPGAAAGRDQRRRRPVRPRRRR